MKTFALLCAVTVIGCTPALADDVSLDLVCKLRHPVVEIATFDAFPGPIKNFLNPKIGGMAARGAFFNSTDVIERPGPSRRFIRAGHSGDKWLLWYEHGGIAYARNIVVLAWKPGDPAPRLIANTIYRDSPCVETDAILDGHLPAQTSAWW